jgi:hypothetical protein
MLWNIDLGFGGSQGPWLAWHPQASKDGNRKPSTWTLRDAEGGTQTTEAPNKAIVLDLGAIRTGWEHASGRQGVSPERRWNASSTRYEPSPGADWKRCFSLPIALSQDKRATWEQASLAARIALDDVLKAIRAAGQDDDGDLLPVVRCTGVKVVQTRAGNTSVPVFALLKWVPRPPALASPVADDDDGEVVENADPPSPPDAGSDGAAVGEQAAPPPANPRDKLAAYNVQRAKQQQQQPAPLPAADAEADFDGVDPFGGDQAELASDFVPPAEPGHITNAMKPLKTRPTRKAASPAKSTSRNKLPESKMPF